MCVCLFVHEFVYLYVCLMPRCVSQGLVFPLHCTLTAVSNKASYDLCMSLGICVRARVWVDRVLILLSNPSHLTSLGCSRVLPNGQSRPAKLAFGWGTELDA